MGWDCPTTYPLLSTVNHESSDFRAATVVDLELAQGDAAPVGMNLSDMLAECLGLVDYATHGAVVLLIVDLEPLDEVDAQPLRVRLLDVRVELPVLEDEPAWRTLVLLGTHMDLLDVAHHVAFLARESLPLL